MGSKGSSSKWAVLKPLQGLKAGVSTSCVFSLGLATSGVFLVGFLAWILVTSYGEVMQQSSKGAQRTANNPTSAVQTCAPPKPSLPRLPQWLPPPGKFFVAWCHLYGWSNRLYCTERALVLAAVLNRTLIVPSVDVCINSTKGNTLDLMIDVAHIRECFLEGQLKLKGTSLRRDGDATFAGQPTSVEELKSQQIQAEVILETGVYALSLQEYLSLYGKDKLSIDLLMCEGHEWYSPCPPANCNAAELIENPPSTDPPIQMFNSSEGFQLTMEKIKILSQATSEAGVLSFGDTFYGSLDPYRLNERTPLAPLFVPSCGLLFQPTKDIFNLAYDFRQTVLNGTDYAAVHFRRKDFAGHCQGRGHCSYWTVEQAAECLATELTRAGLTKLFVASDAYSDELRKLESELGSHGIEIFMFLPATRRSWFESSLVEKVICAQANLFIHQDRSTFSYHILQMRDGLGKTSCGDKALCAGREVGFVPLSSSWLAKLLKKSIT